LIEILDNGAIYISNIQNFIGKSSTEADRKRMYRQHIEEEKQKIVTSRTNVQTKCRRKIQPEIEIEREKELEKELEKKNINEHFEKCWKAYPNKKGKDKITFNDKKELFNYSYEEIQTAIKNLVKEYPARKFQMHGRRFFKGEFKDYLVSAEPTFLEKIEKQEEELFYNEW